LSVSRSIPPCRHEARNGMKLPARWSCVLVFPHNAYLEYAPRVPSASEPKRAGCDGRADDAIPCSGVVFRLAVSMMSRRGLFMFPCVSLVEGAGCPLQPIAKRAPWGRGVRSKAMAPDTTCVCVERCSSSRSALIFLTATGRARCGNSVKANHGGDSPPFHSAPFHIGPEAPSSFCSSRFAWPCRSGTVISRVPLIWQFLEACRHADMKLGTG